MKDKLFPVMKLYKSELEQFSNGVPLDDEDVRNILEDACNALYENGFWNILKQVVELYLEQKEG